MEQTAFQQKLEELKRIKEHRRLEALRQKYSTAPDFSNMNLHDELKVRFDLDELEQLEQKFGSVMPKVQPEPQPDSRLQLAMRNYNDKYRNYINDYLPNSFVQSYDILRSAKDEMDKGNVIGSDNYYHSVGMCENAQIGRPVSTLALGVVKEGLDFYNKYKEKMPVGEILSDNIKDMGNNIRGVYYGLKYPNRNCRDIFQNLDWQTNKMR